VARPLDGMRRRIGVEYIRQGRCVHHPVSGASFERRMILVEYFRQGRWMHNPFVRSEIRRIRLKTEYIRLRPVVCRPQDFAREKDLGCWYPLYRRYRSLDSDRSLARIRMRIASDSDSDRLISNARAALFIPKNLRVRWYQPRERRAGGLRDSRSGGEYTHGTARMPSERIGAPRLLRYARRCLRVTERAELVY